MPCQSPKLVWVGNRLHVLQVGDVIAGNRPVGADRAGFKNTGMRNGYYLPIDCRVCRSCLTKAINSRVGSMLSESQYSTNAAFLTLTYANDAGSDTRADLAHKLLTKRHLREFTQRIDKDRRLGRCRWFISGEHGDLRGRAHWHVILFGVDGRFPDFDYSSRISHSRLWPHGHINAQPMPDEAAFRYAAKYAVKGLSGVKDSSAFLPGVETAVSISNKPPLGARFFGEHGRRMADYAVPLSFRYMPPGGNRLANYHVKGGASRRLVVEAYLDGLAEQGFDVSFYGKPRRDYVPNGRTIPLSPDPWVGKAIEAVIRDRLLASQPLLSPDREAADMAAEFADKQLRHSRMARVNDERKLAADLAKSQERLKRDAAAKRLSDFLRETADPLSAVWDDFDPDAYARLVAKDQRWWD